MNSPPENSEVAMPESPPLVDNTTGESKTKAIGDGDVSRAELQTFLDRGPSYVLTMLDVAPETNGNKLVGFKISNVAPAAESFISGKIGVGDIITHVNGVRVVKPDDLMTAWKSVRDADEIRVDYQRGEEVGNAIWTVQ